MRDDKVETPMLDEYNARRNFSKTPEPAARIDESMAGSRFTVQKHQARHLHYDLRLSDSGVLKSFAIPKGPSLNPHEKRLAIATEDHPVDYLTFEGVIPPGEYGAGIVMVWDYGSYRNMKDKEGITLQQGIENGHLTIWLDGKRLKGGFALIHTSRGWLLFKMDDAFADSGRDILERETVSALTGRTIEEIGGQESRR